MKNKLCALSLILLLISCSDEIQQFDDSTKQTQNENKELTTRSLDTDDHALGFGYDVTGDYLDKYSIRNSVIDIVKLREFDKNSIITSNEVSGKNQYYYGYTSYDYIKEITKKTCAYQYYVFTTDVYHSSPFMLRYALSTMFSLVSGLYSRSAYSNACMAAKLLSGVR